VQCAASRIQKLGQGDELALAPTRFQAIGH
jgi:hypothetical protein